MPDINCECPECEEYVDVDVDVDSFVCECSEHEIKELIEVLREDGWLKHHDLLEDPRGYSSHEFQDAIDKLCKSYYQLSNEETNLIINLAKRF